MEYQMCGIAGLVNYHTPIPIQCMMDMLQILARLGPDAEGCEENNIDHSQIVLGHRRLSIIDLDDRSNQSMRYQLLRIVFNGEIYNHQSIRRELTSCVYKLEKIVIRK
jgi:asparagine synthase (glutamine-hydrolysing)